MGCEHKMEVNDLFEFYREQYKLELDTKQEITSKAQLVLGALVAVGGLFVYMAKSFTLLITAKSILTAVILIIALLILSVGTCFVLKSFWGHEYSYIPTIGDFEKRRMYLRSHGLKETSILKNLSNIILQELAECCDENSAVNNARNHVLNIGIRIVSCGCLLLLLGGSFFVFFDLDESSPRQPISVKIVDEHSGTEK